MRAALALVPLAALCACAPEPRFEPIPPQSPFVVADDPPRRPCFYSMTEPRADQGIVSGIPRGIGAGPRRWTDEKPTIQCTLPPGGPWQIGMDLVIPPVTFRQTGPIQITFAVNGEPIARARYAESGTYEFRAPLPDHLAKASAPLTLTATVDKPFVSPSDGAKLGVLVSAIGFLEP